MMQAKVYDFDPSYHVADGEDELSEYVVRDVAYIAPDGKAVLENGERSHAYKLMEDAP